MNLLPKQLRKEEFEYYSEQPIEELREHIQYVLSEPSALEFSVNLKGKIATDNYFRIIPKWQSLFIRNYEKETAYLEGKLIAEQKNSTVVKFSVRPNSVFSILYFTFPLGSIIPIAMSYFDSVNRIGFLVGALVFVLVVPSINLVLAANAKNIIKETFITTFYLQPIN